MPLSLKPHVYKTKDGVPTLTRVEPYVRLSSGEGPPIFIQNGAFWTEGGERVSDPPGWVEDAVDRLDDRTKEEVGL